MLLLPRKVSILLFCLFSLSIVACSEDNSDDVNSGTPAPPPAPAPVPAPAPTPVPPPSPPPAPPPAPPPVPPITELDCTTVMPGASLADDFVCAHNAIRASVPPPQPVPDPPLPALIWNQELANFAQSHADACVFAHSNSTNRTNTFGEWVGENIAANTGTGYDPYTIVDLWASEAIDYDYNTNTCANGKQCGHYTQIVWRDTTELGCAKAVCPTLGNTTFTNAEFWVCEYLPGGNYIGQRPY